MRILVATDLHVGFKEREGVRGDDSFHALEEVLATAKAQKVWTFGKMPFCVRFWPVCCSLSAHQILRFRRCWLLRRRHEGYILYDIFQFTAISGSRAPIVIRRALVLLF